MRLPMCGAGAKMLGGLAGAALLGAASPSMAQPAGATRDLSPLEAAIVREHNLARAEPARYAVYLEELLARFDGDQLRVADNVVQVTKEGAAAVREAVAFLRSAEPVPRLTVSLGMSRGARDHVRDQGPTGATGHAGSDGSQVWDRVRRYGEWQGVVAENISYGYDVARDVVMQLIIDDGVPQRGHRANVFNGALTVIGVACGPHARFGTVCTITYAGGFREKS